MAQRKNTARQVASSQQVAEDLQAQGELFPLRSRMSVPLNLNRSCLPVDSFSLMCMGPLLAPETVIARYKALCSLYVFLSDGFFSLDITFDYYLCPIPHYSLHVFWVEKHSNERISRLTGARNFYPSAQEIPDTEMNGRGDWILSFVQSGQVLFQKILWDDNGITPNNSCGREFPFLFVSLTLTTLRALVLQVLRLPIMLVTSCKLFPSFECEDRSQDSQRFLTDP